MVSGIVYFSEIVEHVKDLSGYTNIQPYITQLRRFVFLAERDIGYGGMVVKKSKNYTKGDGSYSSDGTFLILPNDFIEATLLGDLSNAQITIVGNIANLEWTNSSPNDITFIYMGVITDNNGEPVTTRNHFEAVCNYCILKLYSPRVFLGQTGSNRGMLQEYKYDYTESVLAARGNDVMLTESDWEELGLLLNMNKFELNLQDSFVLVNTI